MNNLDKSLIFYNQDVFKKEIWFQIASVDYEKLISLLDFKVVFNSYKNPIKVLDIGCGTGRFPKMLASHLDPEISIDYDGIDPSPYCLEEIKKSLIVPFRVSTLINAKAENLDALNLKENKYDIIWAIHSCYCLENKAIPTVLKVLVQMLNDNNSKLIIYQASSVSSYYLVQNMYYKYVMPQNYQPFVFAPDIQIVLDKLSISYTIETIRFDHAVPANFLEYYLTQCLFSSTPLKFWYLSDKSRAWLESLRIANTYIFPQEVCLITIQRKS